MLEAQREEVAGEEFKPEEQEEGSTERYSLELSPVPFKLSPSKLAKAPEARHQRSQTRSQTRSLTSEKSEKQQQKQIFIIKRDLSKTHGEGKHITKLL